MRFLLIAIIAALALAPVASCRSAQATAQDGSKGITARVLWRVSGYRMGKNATLDEREAKALLFEPLDITEDAIFFRTQGCVHVHFQSESVVASEYLPRVWHVTPQELGIKEEKIRLIKTDCDITSFKQYLHLNDNRLIVPLKGAFLYFDPAVQQ